MVIELSLGGLLTLLGIPTAITSLGLWMLQRKMAKREEIRDKREAAREKNEVLLIQNTRAALALAEATAIAVQRIPDAHCNGDMHAALEYARKVKHEQKDFLTEQGVKAICWASLNFCGQTRKEGLENRYLKKADLDPCDHFCVAVCGHHRHQLSGL